MKNQILSKVLLLALVVVLMVTFASIKSYDLAGEEDIDINPLSTPYEVVGKRILTLIHCQFLTYLLEKRILTSILCRYPLVKVCSKCRKTTLGKTNECADGFWVI